MRTQKIAQKQCFIQNSLIVKNTIMLKNKKLKEIEEISDFQSQVNIIITPVSPNFSIKPYINKRN